MEEKVGQHTESQQPPAPKLINQQIFNALLTSLLFNTGFHLSVSLKEKPRFAGDFSVYLVNILVNNSVVSVHSDFIALLNAHCNSITLSNDNRYPNQLLVVCEIYVEPETTQDTK